MSITEKLCQGMIIQQGALRQHVPMPPIQLRQNARCQRKTFTCKQTCRMCAIAPQRDHVPRRLHHGLVVLAQAEVLDVDEHRLVGVRDLRSHP